MSLLPDSAEGWLEAAVPGLGVQRMVELGGIPPAFPNAKFSTYSKITSFLGVVCFFFFSPEVRALPSP